MPFAQSLVKLLRFCVDDFQHPVVLLGQFALRPLRHIGQSVSIVLRVFQPFAKVHQAIRQMDQGHLTPEQEERLGTTLMRSQAALWDMAAKFGLKPEDLSLDLGPLGKTI